MQYRSQSLEFIKYTDGRGVDGVVEYYYASTTDQVAPEDSADWKDNINDTNFNSENKYLWNYEEITFSDGVVQTTPKAVISIYAAELESITEFYLLSDSEDAPLAPIWNENTESWENLGEWTDKISSPTSDKPFLWNYEVTRYTNKKEYIFGPACIAVHGGSPYTMSLDNDSDVIVFHEKTKEVIGDLPVINATTYKGN
jgi:hypothetical protein